MPDEQQKNEKEKVAPKKNKKAAPKPIDQQIAELQQKQAQLKAREKLLKARQSEADRKARTKRLIEVGAVVEKGLGMELNDPVQREKLLEILTRKRQGKDGTFYTYGATFQKWILTE